MADNYNSSYTGAQVDAAVGKISDRGITTKDSATTLTENTVVLGDSGGRNIKSSTVSASDLSDAISRAGTFNSTGVTAANTLTSDKVVVGSGSRGVEVTTVSKTDLANSVTYSGNFNTYGLANGPKKDDNTQDLVSGNLVAYGGSNKIVDGGVSASTISTMTVGVPQTGSTGTGYLMLNEIPGIKINSKISITAAMASAGSSSKFGTAVLYYGRNFYDVAHIKHAENVINEVGQRNVSYTIAQDSNNLLYVAAADSVVSHGFTSFAAASSYTNNVYNFNVKHNHQYLIVTKWVLTARDPEVETELPFAPANIGFYSGTQSLGSSTVTLTDTTGAAVASTTETIAYTGGTVYAYAFVRPSFTYSGTSDTKSAWVYIQDATAITGDSLAGMFVIDITAPGDDAYNITSSSSSSLVTSLANVYAKYLPSYTTFVAGSGVQRTKYCGPYYSAMDYFRPYYRNWYVKVPFGLRIFIKEYKTSNGSVPCGYIKTISVDPGTNLAIALDQQVELGEACLEFMVGKSDDSELPATGTASGQLAPDDESATSSCAPLMQYVPAEFIGKTIDSSGPLFTWVRHYPAINMANGQEMATNGISAADWDSGNGGWSSTSYVTKTFDLSTITAGGTDSVAIGTISFQTYPYNTAKFSMRSLTTEIDRTRISYAIDSVNGAILQVDQKVNNINNNSLFSTLPTAVGTYKYEITTEGKPGSWSKEEETVDELKVEMLEAMAQAKVTSGSVFTSRFYSTNSTGTRYIDGVDVTSYIINGVGTDATGPVRNDYDRAPFWGEMEDISLPALDASGNALLDSNNEPIMNEFKAIPNYWVRHTYGTDILGQQYEEFSISTKELYGYTRMKTNKDGSTPSHILIGKYFKTINTNISSGVGKGTCTKGFKPMVTTDIFGTDFCYVQSSRFGANSPIQLKTCTIEEYSNIAYAAIIEFNTRNLSSILPGYLGGSYSGWGYLGAEFQGYNNNNTIDQDYIIVPTNTWNNWASRGAVVGKSL